MDDKKIIIEDYSKDQTKYLREVLKDATGKIEFPKEKIIVKGEKSPEEWKNKVSGRNDFGVLRINTQKLDIIGGHIYVPEPATSGENSEPRNIRDRSVRPTWNLDGSKNVNFYGTITESSNTVENNTTDKVGQDVSRFEDNWEGEHSWNINNSENISLYDCISKFSYADGAYIRNSNNIYFENFKTFYNGRQSVGISSGSNIHFKNFIGVRSRRGFFDMEPYSDNQIIEDVWIEGGYADLPYLQILPMGGKGTIKNILITGLNVRNQGATTTLGGDRRGGNARESIIFSGLTRIGSTGARHGVYRCTDNDNFLVEDTFETVDDLGVVAVFENSKGVTIRNSGFPRGKYIILLGDTTPEDVTIYDVKQDLVFLKGNEEIPVIQSNPSIEEKNRLPFSVSELTQKRYDSLGRVYIDPEAPVVVEPDPIPEPTPEEPPVVVDPKPTPTPDKPIETDEEALDMAQKILDFLKKKSSLIAIGVIAVIILLIILL